MTTSRPPSRLLLAAMLTGAFALAPAMGATPATTLKAAYADDFRLGVAVNDDIVAGRDAASQALTAKHFDAITAENVMKAEVVNPKPGVYDFAAADAFVDFGRRHGMFVIGHTLVWHNQTPDWFFVDADGQPNTREAQIERMREYIEKVAGRYKGRVHAWDVVNEVIDEDGTYRDTVWVRGVGDGDELVKHAFRFAHRYAPDAELYYNDFNTWRPEKRDGIVRMVKMLQAQGIRIDGIGMQGHWGLNYPSLADIEAAIDAYAALGLKVMITELDVDVLPLTREGQVIGSVMAHKQFQLPEFKHYLDPYRDGLPADVQQRLADRYAELFALFHRKRDVIDRVSLWGVHDGMSWKNDYPVPGRINHPLLFDRARQPKPALDAVLRVPDERTDSAGETIGRVTAFDPAFHALVPENARIEKIADGFTWAEGPAWIAEGGYLLFNDVPANAMHRWSPREGASPFLKPSGYAGTDTAGLREAGANGLEVEPGGTVLLADSGSRLVARFDPRNKRRTTLAATYDGKRFNSPNDIARRSDGTVFFTDPPYGLKGIDASPLKEQPVNGVYRVDPDGSVHLIEGGLKFPNGIALSPDERTLYVANSDPEHPVWMAYELDARGGVNGRRVLADASDLIAAGASGAPDGLAVSRDGHLFASAPGGLLVMDANGKRLGMIATGARVSNATFGDDGRTLYLTSHTFLARIRVNATGIGFDR